MDMNNGAGAKKMLRSEFVSVRIFVDMSARNCPSASKSRSRGVDCGAFTLIELFVVMAVIIILMGLAFPAFTSVQNSARKTQAKNDLVQIVTAVNAFYTEYGKYPTAAADDPAAKVGPGGTGPTTSLFYALRGLDSATNPRQIVFMSPPEAKDQTSPRSGIRTSDGQLFDPWGVAYAIDMDANYNNEIPNPYTADTGAGSTNIRQGVIAWSLGNDKTGGSSAKNSGIGADDVISWQ